jgi:hypothetical protein
MRVAGRAKTPGRSGMKVVKSMGNFKNKEE